MDELGWGFRYYFVNDDGSLTKISQKNFNSVYFKGGSLPAYKNTLVKWVSVALRTKDRKPAYITRMECGCIKFDDDGKYDDDFRTLTLSRAMNNLDYGIPVPWDTDKSNIIDGSTKFKNKQYDDKYRWEIPKTMVDDVIDLVFPKKKPHIPLVGM